MTEFEQEILAREQEIDVATFFRVLAEAIGWLIPDADVQEDDHG